MRQGDFVFKVALSPDRFEPPLGSVIGCDEGRRDRDLNILARLNVDADVLHDGDVQVVDDAEDEAFAAGGTQVVFERLNVEQKLEAVGPAVLGKRDHRPESQK